MGGRIHIRRANGQFKRGTLADLGFEAATGERRCKRCSTVWRPVLVDGLCPACGVADSEPVVPVSALPGCSCAFPPVRPVPGATCPKCGGQFAKERP